MQFIDLHAQYQALQQEIDENIRRVLEHGKYIMGPEVGELEEKLAAYVGRRPVSYTHLADAQDQDLDGVSGLDAVCLLSDRSHALDSRPALCMSCLLYTSRCV